MFAKTFEGVLLRLLKGADLTGPDAEDMSARFEALRGSGMLPRGRENRETRLNPDQLANAIMGLAAQRASWAAVACGALARYQVIGGADAERFREPTLRHLIARLMTDGPARQAFVRLRLSVSESSKNVHGAATAYFDHDGDVQPTSYLSEFAVSGLMNGQGAFDVERRFAPASRDLVLTRAFFDEVARAVVLSANIREPEGDGGEYDADDAHRARMQRLQIRPNAHVLNVAVDTHAAWPRTETMIPFDGVRLILMPPTRETTTSIHVDLRGNDITSEAAQTVIRRFLSVLAWEDDQYAVFGYGWSGNTAPVAVPKSGPMFASAEPWLPPRRSPGEERANRALAHYRAGRNADHAELVTYAVLSFYKVLEVRFRKNDQISKWIARVLPDVRASLADEEIWARFDRERGAESPEDYIRRAYRLAAAHASIGQPSDEDDTKELQRLTTGADVLRHLARALMIQELQVPVLLAKDLDAKLVLAPSALIGAFQAASPLDPQPEPVRQSISELVDGGLARLDGAQVKIEPRFAALALGYDLERRLDAAAASATVAEADLADQVRIWLEPWGGADFDAEVVRAAAWARHLVAQGRDVVMQALLAVWFDRKTLPLHHGDDIAALTRASPQLVLPGFQDLLSRPDVAAASRAGAILAARAGVPALRPVLIAEARRWVCEIGLMDYPFLGSNSDPADYRTKRLSAVQDLLQAELAFDTPLLVEGETVIFHDAETPDGARICKKALGLLRPGGDNDLWPILRAWAVTTSLRYHDDVGEGVAGVLRSVETGSPLDVMARTQLAVWSASSDPVAMAAARSLSWALGDPEARRVAEPALVGSGFVARRAQELEQSRGHFSPETVAEVREQVARHKGANILRRCEQWTYDPEFELPAKVIDDAVARVAKFDPDGMLFAQATTETSLDVEAVTPVLARTDPKRLGDWMRRFALAASTSALAGGDIYRRHVIRDLVVLGDPELEAIAGAKTPGRAADDLRLRAELARRDGDAQIEFLLAASLPPELTVQLVEESRASGAAGLARVVSALQRGIDDHQRLGLLLFHLAAVLTEVPEALAEQLLTVIDHASTVVRTYVFQLLSLVHADDAATRLQAMEWTVADAGSDQEAWWGSKLLCAGGAPLTYVQTAASPRDVLDVCRRSADGGLRRFAALLDDKVRRISGSTLAPDPAQDIAPLAAAVEAHEDKLSGGRRADWRIAPRTLAQVWKADPSLFDRLGARLAGLDDIQLGDAVHASAGLVLAIIEAGLAVDPARMTPIWRRLPRVIAEGVVYRAEFSTDWVRTMPFAVASAPWGLLDEALELARTDAALMEVTMLAEHEGHAGWLDDAISRDVASATTWRRARGLMLQGLSGRVPTALDPYPRLDARASWLGSVMAAAEVHRRRRFRLDHWFDHFERAATPDEVFASLELVKGAATRWMQFRLARGDLSDLQRRHVARQESQLDRVIEKAEKKMAETFLGSKAVPGVWPPP